MKIKSFNISYLILDGIEFQYHNFYCHLYEYKYKINYTI